MRCPPPHTTCGSVRNASRYTRSRARQPASCLCLFCLAHASVHHGDGRLAVGAALAAQREIAQRHVYVRVTDAKDAPVTTLTPADFVVREDDVAREIVRVGAAPPPTHLALLVDNTNEAQQLLIELEAA